MRPLAGKQRPATAATAMHERVAGVVFAVSVFGEAPPARTRRQVVFQFAVDDLDGVEYPWVVRPPQAKPHERQRIAADHLADRCLRVPVPVPDGQIPVFYLLDRSEHGIDADIVPFDTVTLSRLRVAHIGPILDLAIPVVGDAPAKGGCRVIP